MIVDASTRGRRNRVKGASCERQVASWLHPWFPEACRAVRNTYPDPGDLDCTAPGLFWSVKNCRVEKIDAWMGELEEKRGGRNGLLVVRRVGKSSPGRWWCWLTLGDLMEICSSLYGTTVADLLPDSSAPVRMELQDVMPLLVAANYAAAPKGVSES